MDEKELRGLLSERLHLELYLFKDSMLQKTKEEIYKASYKIEVTMYEILLGDIENLDAGTMRGLLYWGCSILESLYQEWLGYNDGSFDELKAYVGGELEAIAQSVKMDKRKENEDGAEFYQAA